MEIAGMRCGFVLPGGTANEQAELAVAAEEAGWDGIFVWETGYGVDPWGLLCAIAARTSRVRLGTMLTPLPWRRPWKLASQVATLDQLSGGRAILAVGLGASDEGMPSMGEVTDLRGRAERLDEGIDLIRELWAGRRSYKGRHYVYEEGSVDLARAARPVQPRIPIWVVGAWPRPKSMIRVLRCDGVIPQYPRSGPGGTPGDVRELRSWLTQRGAGPELDVIAEGETPADDPAAAAAVVAPWAEAGCTWWLEERWQATAGGQPRMEECRERLDAGPPGR
jgi:alkanesulfonate monooxygenase SsuD/methylene tetrahydromethanopterin reductase-like flavin-dependent oxidoreductase (luciferase family)